MPIHWVIGLSVGVPVPPHLPHLYRLGVVTVVVEVVGVGSVGTPVTRLLEHFLGFGRHPRLALSHATLGRYAVDVVLLGAGEAVLALPPLAVRAPSLRGRLHELKH